MKSFSAFVLETENLFRKFFLKKKLTRQQKKKLKIKKKLCKKLNAFFKICSLGVYSIFYKIRTLLKRKKCLKKKIKIINRLLVKTKLKKNLNKKINLKKNIFFKFVLHFLLKKNNIFANLYQYRKKIFIQ